VVFIEEVLNGMAEPEAVAPGPLPEAILRELEELELSPYESRVLLALLRVGSANSAQLARYSGVPRTSIYQIIEELNHKGLAQRLSVDGPATWASPGRDEVLDRLDALQEERLHQQRARTARIREALASAWPEAPSGAGPYVHVIIGAAQVAGMYDRLLSNAETELLVFNRPPYSQSPESVNQAVLDAVARGVKARALYEAEQWFESSEEFREAMGEYHDAGVRGAVVEHLPIKIAVADRRVALLAMTDPVLPDIGFPTTLLVEHPGFASLQAEAFEKLWDSARPIGGRDRATQKPRRTPAR
jgi:sugar-specific transcriptional regulator TrmB